METANANIERSVLSAIIFDPQIYDDEFVDKLNQNDFTLPSCKSFLKAIDTLHKSGKPIEEEFIKAELLKVKKFNEDDMLDIFSANPVANINPYITKLKEFTGLRETIKATIEARRMAEEGKPIAEVMLPLTEAADRISKQECSSHDKTELFTVKLSAHPKDIENAETLSLIDGFIEYNTVGILYGDSGSGKSLLMLSVCVYLLENTIIDRVNYFDFDNGKADQKNRGIHELLRKYNDRFIYVNLDSLDNANLTPQQVLDGMIDTPVKGTAPYDNQFFVFDTMGELADGSLGKDEVMRPLLDKFKKLRSMGATVQTIHHTTKSKEDISFFGSNYIKIKIDALWHLTPKEGNENNIMEFSIKNMKNRSGNLKDSAFKINPITHTLDHVDYLMTSMNEDDTDFITSVKGAFDGEAVMLNQSELLKAIGTNSDDKTARKLLKKFDGKFWKTEKIASKNNSVMYSLLEDT